MISGRVCVRPGGLGPGSRASDAPALVCDAGLESLDQLASVKAVLSSDLGLSADAVVDCRLALGEAVANAFLHGSSQGTPFCRVRILREAGGVRIAVQDHGGGFDWDGLPRQLPSEVDERGRGVHLIRGIMDGVAILSSPRGTCIEMVKRTMPS